MPTYHSDLTTWGARKERRRSGRISVVTISGLWKPNAWMEGEEHGRVPIMIRDLSLDGAGMETTVPLAVGTEMLLCYSLGEKTLKISCEIVSQHWIGDQVSECLYRHGVRFTDLNSGRIQRLINQLCP